jgi:Protein of unknown function (DUF2946)
MDQATIQAIGKWPQVPDCFGWLSFDKRGEWRIQNEFAQKNNLPGEVIKHIGFKEYIQSHLARDEKGFHFFQNGPQRVFINFAYTPWIIRFYPLENGRWELKNTFGETVKPSGCYIDELNQISFAADFEIELLQSNGHFIRTKVPSLGLLHDHDLEIFSSFAKIFQSSCGSIGEFLWHEKIDIEPIHSKDISKTFNFVQTPKPNLT